MPPPLALLLCTIFVAFLLRLERKQAPQVSRALWIPTIWVLSIFSRGVGSWFEVGSPDIESGSPLDQVFLVILLCVSLFVLSKRNFSWSRFAEENRWLIIVVVYMFISIFWSNVPAISFRRWVRELIAFAMYLQVFSESNPRLAVQSMLRRTIYILIPFSLLLIKYFPNYGVAYARWSGERMWVGAALQKNGLGRLCIVGTLFLIWTLVGRIRRHDIPIIKYQTYVEVFLLIMTLYLLAGPERTLSYSATSTVSLAAGLLALSGLYWMNKRGLALKVNTLRFIITIIIAYGTITPFLGRLAVFDVSSTFGRTENLTGRGEIWAILIPFAMKRPIFGHGVGGFWTTAMRNLTSSHAHNGYLEVILNFGIVGLVIITLMLLNICRKAHFTVAIDFDWGVLFVCYMIMELVHNIAEVGIESLTNPMMAIILFFFVSSPRVSRIEASP